MVRKTVMISIVAERYDIHPQTLRLYEREGLITPVRSQGNTRLYDDVTLARLESILFLTRELGVNLAGVEVILNLREQMAQLQAEQSHLQRVLQEQRRDRRAGVRRETALVRIQAGPLVRRDG